MLYALLSLLSLVLALRLFNLRRDLRTLTEELHPAIESDSNTRLATASGDRILKAAADQWNRELLTLRQERRKYEQGDRELKEAVTNMAHDLRTPLTAISGYLELLEKEELNDNAFRYCAVIRERTETMKTLTEELFRYSLVNAEETTERESVCLNAALEDALCAYYGALTAAGITPKIEICETPVKRRLNREAVDRILENLLHNACKYAERELSLRLTEDGTIELSNPTTMNAVDAAKLFDRFYTVQTAKGSTGLGLSIARTLTERMGGTIDAEAENGVLTIRLRFSA